MAGHSTQRAAFLTEDMSLFEWTSAAGGVPCGVSLPGPLSRSPSEALLPPGRLAWGAAPRSLWVSSARHLHHVDLRQKRPASKVLLSTAVRSREVNGADPRVSEGGGSRRRGASSSEAKGIRVGAMERHPGDENLLFLSVDTELWMVDVR